MTTGRVLGLYSFLLALFVAVPAMAEDCQLKQLADLTVSISKSGNLLVPVTVEGRNLKLILSMDSIASGISSSIANQLNAPRAMMPENLSINFDDIEARENITPQVAIGSATGPAVLAIIPKGSSMDSEADGYLAFDILKNFDVELNLSKNGMKLFSQAHCEGKVIYWTQSAAVAVMPIEVRGHFGFIFPMQLDGKYVEAAPETSSGTAQLSSLVADEVFGVKNQQAHTFETLSADGLTIGHPNLGIYRDDTNGECRGNLASRDKALFNETDVRNVRCYGPPELMLGRSQMAALRLYFAFGERKIYATAASAQ